MKTLPKIILKHPTKNVLLLKASSNYTFLTFKTGRNKVSAYSLNVFESHLKRTQFVRINRSVLVNTSYIKRYFKENGKDFLELNDRSTIAIPRRRKEQLKSDYPTIFNSKFS